MTNKIATGTALVALLAGSAAFAQGTLNVYNWSDYIAEDTIEKFEEETGVDVTYDVYDENAVLEAKLLSGNSGYDVVVPTADFLQRQIPAGVYAELDKAQLPNLENMNPELMERVAQFDEGNTHGVIYMWGTTALGMNVPKIKEILGEDAPIDSWSILFDPANAEALSACGITVLDASEELLPAAALYLGTDPTDQSQEAMEAQTEAIMQIRPFIRNFDSSGYMTALANGDICLALGYSGDVLQARDRAEEAGNGVEVSFVNPKEGARLWFDMMAIPADSQNKENAHKFINFIMQPEITADITNYVNYASANDPAMEFVEEEIRNDEAVFPSDEVREKLFVTTPLEPRMERVRTRLWTTIKTGQ
ncbi:polyamine ABC transporter substrate-binding protein [Paracoccaceae bacterium GXU_MW_L88]